jgi:group I intron endonuclease
MFNLRGNCPFYSNNKYKMENNVNNTSWLENITWYYINQEGYTDKALKNLPAIYVFMCLPSPDKEACYYVGASIKLAKRISSHRYLVINWDRYKNSGCSSLYQRIRECGWRNFKLGILEYPDVSNMLDTEQKRKLLLEREQYYLNEIKPSLNVCKIVNSPLGVKRNLTFSKNLSKARRGKTNKSPSRVNSRPKTITKETKSLISLRCQGVRVKVFDQGNNLIKEFPTITSAALHFGVNNKTISRINKTGKSYDDYIYKFEVKETRVNVHYSRKRT